MLQLEPISHCNLACPACPVTQFDADPSYRDDRAAILPLATMLDVVDQLPDLEKILFYNFGEPFLHPDAIEFLRHRAAAASRDRPAHQHQRPGSHPGKDRAHRGRRAARPDRLLDRRRHRGELSALPRRGQSGARPRKPRESRRGGAAPGHSRTHRNRLAVHPLRVERLPRRDRCGARPGGRDRRPAVLRPDAHRGSLATPGRGRAGVARPAGSRGRLVRLDVRPAGGAPRPRSCRIGRALRRQPDGGQRADRDRARRALRPRPAGREPLRVLLEVEPRPGARRRLSHRRPAAFPTTAPNGASCARSRCPPRAASRAARPIWSSMAGRPASPAGTSC